MKDSEVPPAIMAENAQRAAAFLRVMSHEGRLMTLCHLNDREYSVGQLEALLQMRQAAVSQMLARLREEGLVATRREGKAVYYRLQDKTVRDVLTLLNDRFAQADDHG